eukprot:TRINITY_DN380_c0_g1_i3.p1 TRINITY_DN380_c0_g1~~TRINITY_DN380_c0_g1_i3.p1  ORF type:complete len:132 (-),score=15.96 TRINITY_DN380_c0_g1_i3:73-468(-)
MGGCPRRTCQPDNSHPRRFGDGDCRTAGVAPLPPPTGEPKLDDTVQDSVEWAKPTNGIVNVIAKLDLKPSQIKRLRYCDKTEINSTMEGEMKVGAAEWGKPLQTAEAIKWYQRRRQIDFSFLKCNIKIVSD